VDLREIIATIRISGDLSLTETSQTRCSLGIRLEFCRKGRKPLEWCGCAKSQLSRTNAIGPPAALLNSIEVRNASKRELWRVPFRQRRTSKLRSTLLAVAKSALGLGACADFSMGLMSRPLGRNLIKGIPESARLEWLVLI
jgi:hypothetical protein